MKINIGKIILKIIIFFIMFFILNKIFVVKILQESYETYEEYNKKEDLNLYLKTSVERNGYDMFSSNFIEKYVKDGNIHTSDLITVIQGKFDTDEYYDKETDDTLRITNVNDNENITYEIEDRSYYTNVMFSSSAANTMTTFKEVNVLKKLYIMFFKNKLMYLEKVEDKWCYVIKVIDTMYSALDKDGNRLYCEYKVWIDVDTKLTVKEITLVDEPDGTIQENIAEYEYKFDVVTDDDVAWPDLAGKNLEIK